MAAPRSVRGAGPDKTTLFFPVPLNDIRPGWGATTTGRRTSNWKCGGGADLGYHCGARGTFWNIRSQSPLNYPPRGFGPDSMNFVALQTTQTGEATPGGKWFESIPPNALEPQDLQAAQIKRRLGAK